MISIWNVDVVPTNNQWENAQALLGGALLREQSGGFYCNLKGTELWTELSYV